MRDRTLAVAGWLGECGVGIGDCVAICLPKALESVLLIYGVHAVGAAYVPLQFGAPALRLLESLRAIKPRLLVTTSTLAVELAGAKLAMDAWTTETLDPARDGSGLDRLLEGIAPAQAIPERAARDLAAVMLTSGSTGAPKGVLRGHDSVPLRSWLAPGAIREEERFISTSALNYTSSHDVFLCLVGGCSVHLLSEREAMFPDRVAEVLARERITTWVTTATALRLLLEDGALERHDVTALRRVRIAGEPLRPDLLRATMDALPETGFTNVYGATEAATMLVYDVPRPFPETMAAVPLGRSAGNFEIRLCDDEGRDVPKGEIGEICAVGGPMMLGYWNDQALTESKRLPGIPLSYRTGDFARRGSDGLFYSLGRADDMVKIRGHRFDLGEVEAVLRSHDEVREAATFAMTRPGGETVIRAAVLLQAGSRLNEAELRGHCAARLPVFVRPSSVTPMKEFPLLSTGKVDRAALRDLLGADTRKA